MWIVVDAMGGDHAPSSPIEGALLAARAYGVTIVFVGQPDVIEEALANHNTVGVSYEIEPASADALVHAWPGGTAMVDYTVVPDAGHSALEPGIRSALVAATERFASLF